MGAADDLASRYRQNYIAKQEDMEFLELRNAAIQKVKFTGLDLGHLRLRC